MAQPQAFAEIGAGFQTFAQRLGIAAEDQRSRDATQKTVEHPDIEPCLQATVAPGYIEAGAGDRDSDDYNEPAFLQGLAKEQNGAEINRHLLT